MKYLFLNINGPLSYNYGKLMLDLFSQKVGELVTLDVVLLAGLNVSHFQYA